MAGKGLFKIVGGTRGALILEEKTNNSIYCLAVYKQNKNLAVCTRRLFACTNCSCKHSFRGREGEQDHPNRRGVPFIPVLLPSHCCPCFMSRRITYCTVPTRRILAFHLSAVKGSRCDVRSLLTVEKITTEDLFAT